LKKYTKLFSWYIINLLLTLVLVFIFEHFYGIPTRTKKLLFLSSLICSIIFSIVLFSPKHIKFLSWYALNLPLSERFIDLQFPVFLTIALTFVFECCFYKFCTHHTILLLALYSFVCSIFSFFIVLFLQNRLIEIVFGNPLKEFITSLKGRHPVTKKFGSRILRKFITGEFKPDVYKGIYNLDDLLRKIETRNVFDLPSDLYAVLLQESADMKPDCLLATWDFSLVRIKEAFENNTNQLKPEYRGYFDTLGKIYSNIKNPDDKIRIFIFSGETQFHEYQGYKEWEKVLEMHYKELQFKEVLWCEKSTLQGLRTSHDEAYMDDFVYFEYRLFKKWWINKWVIGKDSNSKIHLAHSKEVTTQSKELFDKLKGKSTHINLEVYFNGSVDNKI